VLRILLEKPKPWTLTEIANELKAETSRVAQAFFTQQIRFAISLGAISKALSSLDEQLWVRRQGSSVVVPNRAACLLEWAENTRNATAGALRSSFETSTLVGSTLTQINSGLEPLLRAPYAFHLRRQRQPMLLYRCGSRRCFFCFRNRMTRSSANSTTALHPNEPHDLCFIYPYDEGVFLYARNEASPPRSPTSKRI